MRHFGDSMEIGKDSVRHNGSLRQALRGAGRLSRIESGLTLTRRERLRQVVILCASFARNVAYFRAGQSQTGSEALARSAFWAQVSVNFLDIAVLEWCKLLGDEKDKHFWRMLSLTLQPLKPTFLLSWK